MELLSALVAKAEVEVADANLDPGIRHAVLILRAGSVETYESCEGGAGHAFPEPTVRFHGPPSEGLRALAWATQHALPVADLRRVWHWQHGEVVGPTWELSFFRKMGGISG